MQVSQVLNCIFSSWYPKFKSVTLDSVIIPLPDDFVEYLKADDMIYPEDREQEITGNSTEDEEVDWSDSDPGLQAQRFPQLDELIKSAIKRFDGVFPKLNWSSAKDAAWMSLNNAMKCTTPSDVYLLLKSSEVIPHDLTEPFKHCKLEENSCPPKVQYELILRKWKDINPAMEFRCFVSENVLIGVCQRDIENFYSYTNQEQVEIMSDVITFFKTKIQNRFLDDKFVFDIYRESKNNVMLIDFNPFGQTTDALLFDWEHLLRNTYHDTDPEFRYVKSENDTQPNPYRNYILLSEDLIAYNSARDPEKLLQS